MELKELTEILRKELPGFKVRRNKKRLWVSISLPEIPDIYVLEAVYPELFNDVYISLLDMTSINSGFGSYGKGSSVPLEEAIDFIRPYYEGWLEFKKHVDSFNLEDTISVLSNLGFTWSLVDDSLSATEDNYIKCHLGESKPGMDRLDIDIRLFWIDHSEGKFYLYHCMITKNLKCLYTAYAPSLDKLLDELTG